MAERFVQEATNSLNPVYAQQEQAINSQIPALQQLYQTLYQGLDAKQATETQGILESSAARGLTRSSIPTDLQTSLGQSMIQAKGQLGAQQAGELAKINMQLGELGLQKTQGIQSLANSLYDRDMKERQFQMQQEQQRQQQAMAEREFQMKVQLARQQATQAVGIDYGGNLINSMQSWFKGQKSMPSRQAQDKFVDSWLNSNGVKGAGNRQVFWDLVNAQFKRVGDPTKDWTWKR